MGTIFCLHRVVPTAQSSKLNRFIEIAPQHLEKLIIGLQKMDVVFINLTTIHQIINQKQYKGKRFVHFSLDDGYADNYTFAFPLFQKYSIPFSIFISTAFINQPSPFIWWYCIEEIVNNELAIDLRTYGLVITKQQYQTHTKEFLFNKLKTVLLENVDKNSDYFKQIISNILTENQLLAPPMLNWKQLLAMHQSGICEIGAHTHTHARFAKTDANTQQKEIDSNKDIIKKMIGITSHFFAYPYGAIEDIGNWQEAKNTLEKCKIKLALTTIPHLFDTSTEWYKIPRVFINNESNTYTLLSRISGIYQKKQHGAFKQ